MPLFHTGNINIIPVLSSSYLASDVLFAPVELGEPRVLQQSDNATAEIGLMTDSHRNFVAVIEKVGLTWGVSNAPSITLLFFEGNPTSFGALNDACSINESDLRSRVATVKVDKSNYQSLNSLQYLDITGDVIGSIQIHRDSPLYLAGIIDEAYSGSLLDQLNIQLDISIGSTRDGY